MPNKTYGIYGKSTATLDFRCGKASVRATFTGGVPDQKTNKPATVTTADSVAQFIIEHDPKFGSLVRLISSYPTTAEKEAAKRAKAAETKAEAKTSTVTGTKSEPEGEAPEPETPVEGAVTERAMNANVHDEVTTYNEAREVLMDLGATAKETFSKQACRATAERYNVIFPNWK